jgi:uncharacterized protein YxjI
MQTFELTQKILSVGPTYEVRPVESTASDPLLTIRGKLFSATPSLSIAEGSDGPVVGSMKGNFTRTKFECTEGDRVLGSIAFPMLALRKSFTLKANAKEYHADGGYLAGEFVCKDGDTGEVVMTIKKELSLRDKFRIEASETIPAPLALLAAVAVDQRFFQE